MNLADTCHVLQNCCGRVAVLDFTHSVIVVRSISARLPVCMATFSLSFLFFPIKILSSTLFNDTSRCRNMRASVFEFTKSSYCFHDGLGLPALNPSATTRQVRYLCIIKELSHLLQFLPFAGNVALAVCLSVQR